MLTSLQVQVRAHSIIIATGATAKRLGIPNEERFWSNGISACAICDGASPAFKQKELAVVGGGDTAVEEALYLCKYGKHVRALTRVLPAVTPWNGTARAVEALSPLGRGRCIC